MGTTTSAAPPLPGEKIAVTDFLQGSEFSLGLN
jgi:hypothetical protein